MTPGPEGSSFTGAEIPVPPLPDDDGASSPELSRELDAFAHGSGSGSAVLNALASARLFVPVVAVLDTASTAANGLRQEKESSMATVVLDSAEHGRALLAFSSIDSLNAWRADARPVPVPAPLAARAAVGEAASSLLVDVSGPTAFAVAGRELLLLAASARESAGAGAEDPVLAAAVQRVLVSVGLPVSTDFDLAPDSREGGEGTVLLTIDLDGEQHGDRVVRALGADDVVSRLTPAGLRVVFGDTPS